MNARMLSWMVVLMALPSVLGVCAPSRPASEDTGTALRQMRVALSDTRHAINNHETEIRIFEEKLHNQEITFDQFRQELLDGLQAQKDYSRATTINLESKIDFLDNAIKGLTADLKQLKSQSNDSVQVLSQYKQKMLELEKILDAQNEHLKNVEVALNSIMEVLQAKEAAEKASALVDKGGEGCKTYKVQAGDTLEKIAANFSTRHHKISVQALKEYNNLSSDRIVVGQTLKIP